MLLVIYVGNLFYAYESIEVLQGIKAKLSTAIYDGLWNCDIIYRYGHQVQSRPRRSRTVTIAFI